MKMLLHGGMALLLVLGFLVQSQSLADDKKTPDKKTEKEKEKDKDKDKKKPITGDVTVNAELNDKDVKDKSRKDMYCKIYTYKMVEGRTYTIDMKSTDFDTWLRLENPKGNQVAEDDDGGGGLDSQIVYKAEKGGDFTIICTTFGAGDTGKFVLTVKEAKEEVQPKDGVRQAPARQVGVLPGDRATLPALTLDRLRTKRE